MASRSASEPGSGASPGTSEVICVSIAALGAVERIRASTLSAVFAKRAGPASGSELGTVLISQRISLRSARMLRAMPPWNVPIWTVS